MEITPYYFERGKSKTNHVTDIKSNAKQSQNDATQGNSDGNDELKNMGQLLKHNPKKRMKSST